MQPTSDFQSQSRALNVKDALSYLDQVKIQFSVQPEVYNKFLDIMKDFKSQRCDYFDYCHNYCGTAFNFKAISLSAHDAFFYLGASDAFIILTADCMPKTMLINSIDTPGVIERVSTLFKGHPSLIVGFNTFLPPGYKIEINLDNPGHSFTITTPDSTIQSGGPLMNVSQSHSTGSSHFAVSGQQQPQTLVHQQPHQAIMPPVHIHQAFQSISNSATMNNVSVNAAAPSTSSAHVNKKPPVEFNHAINYVNKIKVRNARIVVCRFSPLLWSDIFTIFILESIRQ